MVYGSMGCFIETFQSQELWAVLLKHFNLMVEKEGLATARIWNSKENGIQLVFPWERPQEVLLLDTHISLKGQILANSLLYKIKMS